MCLLFPGDQYISLNHSEHEFLRALTAHTVENPLICKQILMTNSLGNYVINCYADGILINEMLEL